MKSLQHIIGIEPREVSKEPKDYDFGTGRYPHQRKEPELKYMFHLEVSLVQDWIAQPVEAFDRMAALLGFETSETVVMYAPQPEDTWRGKTVNAILAARKAAIERSETVKAMRHGVQVLKFQPAYDRIALQNACDVLKEIDRQNSESAYAPSSEKLS